MSLSASWCARASSPIFFDVVKDAPCVLTARPALRFSNQYTPRTDAQCKIVCTTICCCLKATQQPTQQGDNPSDLQGFLFGFTKPSCVDKTNSR
jgi:hypothetical protein